MSSVGDEIIAGLSGFADDLERGDLSGYRITTMTTPAGLTAAATEVVAWYGGVRSAGGQWAPLAEKIVACARAVLAAPDHALLLAAVAAGRAIVYPQRSEVWVAKGNRTFPVGLDVFGCPVVTAELRAALEGT